MECETNDDKFPSYSPKYSKAAVLFMVKERLKKPDKLGYQVSRRRIGRIIKEQELVSKYTVDQHKVSKSSINEYGIR